MQSPTLGGFCQLVQREVLAGVSQIQGLAPRRMTLQVGLEGVFNAEGGWHLARVVSVDVPATREPETVRSLLTLEFDFPSAGGTAGRSAALSGSTRPANVPSSQEEVEGGDPGSVRRRLELILGGPPGFTTGARAEMLADLLREFGRPAILDAIARDWVTQFDTGIDASPSVSH